MNDDDLWAEYTRVQAVAASPRLSNRTQAAEEALSAILDKIERRQSISSQQVEDLLTNRARTLRERRKLLAKHAHLFAVPVNDDRRAEARAELAEHERRCAAREWRVLVSAGLGHTYHHIADAENVPVATIKTWVRRARLKLAA